MSETSIRELIFRSHKIFPFLHKAALLTAIDLHGKNEKHHNKVYIANLKKLGVYCHSEEENLVLVEGKFPVLILENLNEIGRSILYSKMLTYSCRLGYTLFIGDNVWWSTVILSKNELMENKLDEH